MNGLTKEQEEEYRRFQSLTEEQKIAEKTEKYKDELEKNAQCLHLNLEHVVYQCRYMKPLISVTFGYQQDYMQVGVSIRCKDCDKCWDATTMDATIVSN